MKFLTADDVIAEVRRLAAESPDCVYESPDGDCHYQRGECSNGSVGCIWGQALRRWGIIDESRERAAVLVSRYGAGLSDQQHEWVHAVQEFQDRGESWGDAVKAADHDWPLS